MPAVATEELLELLSEAAVEIANLDGPANIVCRRLRTMQKRLESLTTTIGELAQRVGIAPWDLLDAARAAGVCVFWHEGQQFRSPLELLAYLEQEHYYDPVPELEVDLTRDQIERLAGELGVELPELHPEAAAHVAGNKPLRKFAASDTELSERAARRRREQTG
jgi:hypothetical protein